METAIIVALIGLVGSLSAAFIAGIVQLNKKVGPTNGNGSMSVMLEQILVDSREQSRLVNEQSKVVADHVADDKRELANLHKKIDNVKTEISGLHRQLDSLDEYTHDFKHEWKNSEAAREGWKQIALELADERRRNPSA